MNTNKNEFELESKQKKIKIVEDKIQKVFENPREKLKSSFLKKQ
jgi:hypothetical protein